MARRRIRDLLPKTAEAGQLVAVDKPGYAKAGTLAVGAAGGLATFDATTAGDAATLVLAAALVDDLSGVTQTAGGRLTAITSLGLAGANAIDAQLKAWTQGEDYEPTTITRDANDVVTSAVLKWPDNSAGVFTATTVNATYNTVDAFTVTHTTSGRTVTQAAVTRNANGAVTAKPALVVS